MVSEKNGSFWYLRQKHIWLKFLMTCLGNFSCYFICLWTQTLVRGNVIVSFQCTYELIHVHFSFILCGFIIYGLSQSALHMIYNLWMISNFLLKVIFGLWELFYSKVLLITVYFWHCIIIPWLLSETTFSWKCPDTEVGNWKSSVVFCFIIFFFIFFIPFCFNVR